MHSLANRSQGQRDHCRCILLRACRWQWARYAAARREPHVDSSPDLIWSQLFGRTDTCRRRRVRANLQLALIVARRGGGSAESGGRSSVEKPSRHRVRYGGHRFGSVSA